MADENQVETREVKTEEGLQTRGRGGGQPKPKTPSGERRPWTRPTSNTTPENRTDDQQ